MPGFTANRKKGFTSSVDLTFAHFWAVCTVGFLAIFFISDICYALCIHWASAFLLGLALQRPYAAVVHLKTCIRNKSYKIFWFYIPCLFIQLYKAFSPTKARNSPRAFRGKNFGAPIHQTGTKIFIPARFFQF